MRDMRSSTSSILVPGAIALAVSAWLGVQALPARAATCAADCDGDGTVQIFELITVVNVSLGRLAPSACVAGDVDGNGEVEVSELVLGVNAALAGCSAAAQCGAGTYIYTFTNYCAEQIYIGQNGPGSASTPPSFPEAGNWSVAAACTVANQATVCTGAGSVCQVPAGEAVGQCTCATDTDCGGAPCAGGLCSTVTTFCMPQNWSSGVFWPRTGCTLSNGDLTCATGQCGGSPRTLSGGRLDCGSVSGPNGQNGPTAPAIRFEPTTTSAGALNYDVSIINGFNVEMSVTVIGGGAACPNAGCTADLIGSCPANLVYGNPYQVQAQATPTPVGCYQPQDACNSAGAGPAQTPPAGLKCSDTIAVDALGNAPAPTTDCRDVTGDPVTYLDMYEAENTADSMTNTQASTNSGTTSAFSAADCPPDTEFATAFVASGSCNTDADCTTGQSCTSAKQCAVLPPSGAGVCLQFVNNVLVPDYGCTPSNVGSACGQYASSFTDALGYTCQQVTYSGGTAYPCVPATLSGLGTCEISGGEGFYPGVGGSFNPAWVQAGIQAGGGTTAYYETFKAACPGAYVFQYDDKSADYGCNIAASSASGFAITFCGSAVSTQTPAGSTPSATPTAAAPTSTPTASGPSTATATVTSAGQPTPTATGGSASLTWNQGGASSTTIAVPLAGMSYSAGALVLNDSQARFCLTAGKQPIVTVDLGAASMPVVGAPPASTSQLDIANVPAAVTPGTYDVLIQTYPGCGDSPLLLTMPGAIQYQ